MRRNLISLFDWLWRALKSGLLAATNDLRSESSFGFRFEVFIGEASRL